MPPPSSEPPGGRLLPFHIAYIALALFSVLLLRDLWVTSRDVVQLPYSEFQQLLRDGAIAKVLIGEAEIRGEFKQERDGKTRFVTNRVEPERVS